MARGLETSSAGNHEGVTSHSNNALRGKRLVFLVGAPRSGTTWLELLLAQSPAVVAAYETQLFSGYMNSCFRIWNDLRHKELSSGLHHYLTPDEYLLSLRNLAASILVTIAARKPIAKIVLEKSPDHAFCSKEILELFPYAEFLHITRDPRSVVASLLAGSKTWASTWAPHDIHEACHKWRRHVESARQIRLTGARYHELDYRDLVEDGPRVLKGVFDWLGVSTTLEDCATYYDECSIEKLRKGVNANTQIINLSRRPREFFRHGKTDHWQHELSARKVALIEELTEPLLTELGYRRAPRSYVISCFLRASLASAKVRKAIKWRLQGLADRL